jgi:hypothetical protein
MHAVSYNPLRKTKEQTRRNNSIRFLQVFDKGFHLLALNLIGIDNLLCERAKRLLWSSVIQIQLITQQHFQAPHINIKVLLR